MKSLVYQLAIFIHPVDDLNASVSGADHSFSSLIIDEARTTTDSMLQIFRGQNGYSLAAEFKLQEMLKKLIDSEANGDK